MSVLGLSVGLISMILGFVVWPYGDPQHHDIERGMLGLGLGLEANIWSLVLVLALTTMALALVVKGLGLASFVQRCCWPLVVRPCQVP